MEQNFKIWDNREKKIIEVTAKKTGQEWVGFCCFHNDVKTPNLYINEEKGVYLCRACGAKGRLYIEKNHYKRSSKKMQEKYSQKKEYQEERKKVLDSLSVDLDNWESFPEEIKKEILTELPLNLCFLKEGTERNLAIDALDKAGIIRRAESQRRIKKIISLIKKPEGDNKKGEKKERKIKTKTLIPGLVHLVKEGEKVVYLLQNEGKFYIEEEYKGDNGVTCRPKQDLPMYHVGVDIIEEPREINFKKLLKEIISFIKSYLELSENKGYLILALWVFHTYLIEKFEVTPIIYFYGLKETGKTRAGEVLEQLAFRCERLTSPTEATLFRSAEYFKTALIIDEIKLWGKNGNEEVERLIKSRYKRGLKVNRCNLNKTGEEQIEYFDVFAPLVLATTYDIPLIIQDRSIRFLMQKNANPKVERDIDKELAHKLRNQLTIFRANLLERELKEVKPISRRRLNEIMRPLYQILKEVDPDREKEFKLIVKNLEENRKSEERFTSIALVVEEIVKFYNKTGQDFISTKELTARLNEDRSDNEKTNTTRVGRLVKPLGFQKIEKERKLGYVINFEILNHLIERFNLSHIKAENQSLFNT